jgi:hypothetical protein
MRCPHRRAKRQPIPPILKSHPHKETDHQTHVPRQRNAPPSPSSLAPPPRPVRLPRAAFPAFSPSNPPSGPSVCSLGTLRAPHPTFPLPSPRAVLLRSRQS